MGKGVELSKSIPASDNPSVELASLQLRYNQEGCFNVWRRLDFMHATVTALSELLALPAREQVENEILHEGTFPAGQGEHVQVQLPQDEPGDDNFSDTVAQEDTMTAEESGKKQAKDKAKKPAKEKNKKPAAEEKNKNPTAENKNPAEEKNKKQATEKNKNSQQTIKTRTQQK